jgi:hypothetical protein
MLAKEKTVGRGKLAAASADCNTWPCSVLSTPPPLASPRSHRHQRRQLLRLRGLEGASVWCDARELSANASCLLLHHSPGCSAVPRLLRRGDAGRVPQEHVVRVSCREPVNLLCSLEMAPQHALPAATALAGAAAQGARRFVAVVCGPKGAGRAALARRVLADFPEKFAAAPRLTARAPHPRELQAATAAAAAFTTLLPPPLAAGSCKAGGVEPVAVAAAPPGALPAIGADAPGSEFLRYVSQHDLGLLQAAGGLAEHGSHLGAAAGTPLWGLEAAWAAGKAALVVAPLSAAEALKRLPGAKVRAAGDAR